MWLALTPGTNSRSADEEIMGRLKCLSGNERIRDRSMVISAAQAICRWVATLGLLCERYVWKDDAEALEKTGAGNHLIHEGRV